MNPHFLESKHLRSWNYPFVCSPWGSWGRRWWPDPGRAASQPDHLYGYRWGPAEPVCCFVAVLDLATLPRFGQNRSTTDGAVSEWSLPDIRKMWVSNHQDRKPCWRLVFLVCYCVFVTLSPALKANAPLIRMWFQLRFSTSIPTFVALRKGKQI